MLGEEQTSLTDIEKLMTAQMLMQICVCNLWDCHKSEFGQLRSSTALGDALWMHPPAQREGKHLSYPLLECYWREIWER